MHIIFQQFSNEILFNISLYLIEPPIDIISIGWYNNKYKIQFCKKSFYKKLNIYSNIIKYYIFKNEYGKLFTLYITIYNLNQSLRKYIPTYVFADKIFKLYPYISYSSLISLEYDTELNFQKKIKQIEKCHLSSINNIKKFILRELNYFIYYYDKTKYQNNFYSYYFNYYSIL
jgi:hypothetical protein